MRMPSFDHPIFTESIARIRAELGRRTAGDPALARWLQRLNPLERDVLERCIHSSGDVTIATDLVFSPAGADVLPAPAAETAAVAGACSQALAALRAGAPILTDTAMAAAAVTPMARRSLGVTVHGLLDWAPPQAPCGSTRSAAAVESAWTALTASGPAPLVLIGSAPTALERLLDLVAAGAPAPALVVGMPVGFVGVAESKRRLAASGLAQIRLEGSRGGAALAAAAINALLRRAWLDQAACPV
ncbi:MAG: precorrin-8X methylmutase [Cyanobium sp.]